MFRPPFTGDQFGHRQPVLLKRPRTKTIQTGGRFSASDPGIRLCPRRPPAGDLHPPGAPSVPQVGRSVGRLLSFGLVSPLRLLRGDLEVAGVRATFRELPQEVAAVSELRPGEREVWVPEEFQAGENRRTGTTRRGRTRSGQEGPPQDGAAPNFVPWRGAGVREDPAGGATRPQGPGYPPAVRWSFCPFVGLVWAVGVPSSVFAHAGSRRTSCRR